MVSLIKEVLASVRQVVVQQRKNYSNALLHGRSRGRPIEREAHEQAALSQAKLKYLVPLYRALNAAVQQKGSGKGVGLYAKRYHLVFSQMVALHRSGSYGEIERLFGRETSALLLATPAEDVPFTAWKVTTIGELLLRADVQVGDELRAQKILNQKVRTARSAFLSSLTAEQRILFREAIVAEAATGRHALTFDRRDLEGL